MKKFYPNLRIPLTALIVLLCTQVKAQKTWDLGLNTTSVLQNTIGLNTNSTEIVEPYSLIFRYGNDSGAFRFGIGGGLSTDNNQTFSTGVLSTNTNALNLALGYELRKQVTPRLRYFFGLEGVYGKEEEFSTFEFTLSSSFQTATTSNTHEYYMLSPFFGLQFQINDWLAISTKSRMEFRMTESVEEAFDESTGTKIGPNKSTDYSIHHYLPNSIYLYFNLSGLKSINLNKR